MKLLKKSIKSLSGRWHHIISVYLVIEIIKSILFLFVLRFDSFGILNQIMRAGFSALLFVSIYRIVFQRYGWTKSISFDTSLLNVFIGYINLSFVIYIINYLLQFKPGLEYVRMIIISIALFIMIFIPMLGFKGNTSLINATRESIMIIQEDSKDLIGLFIIYGLFYFLNNIVLVNIVGINIISFLYLLIISPQTAGLILVYLPGIIILLLVQAISMVLLVLSTVMVQKHCEYR